MDGKLLRYCSSSERIKRRCASTIHLRPATTCTDKNNFKRDSSPFLMLRRRSQHVLSPSPISLDSFKLPPVSLSNSKKCAFLQAPQEYGYSSEKPYEQPSPQKSIYNGSHSSKNRYSDQIISSITLSKDNHVEVVKEIDFKNASDVAIIPSSKKRGSMCVTELWSKKERMQIADAIISKNKYKGQSSLRASTPFPGISFSDCLNSYSCSSGESSPIIESDKEPDEPKICPSLNLVDARYYYITTMLPELKNPKASLEEKFEVVSKYKEVYKRQEQKLSVSGSPLGSQSPNDPHSPKFFQEKQVFKVRKSLRCDSKSKFFFTIKTPKT